MSVNNTINWFEKASYDYPDLRSPQPCPRGAFCQYKLINPKTGVMELACCRMVHPGEEGTGERRIIPGPTSIPLQRGATVRLTGGATFYERRHKNIPWRVWAQQKGIPLPPIDQPWEKVKRLAYLPKPFPPKRRTVVKKEESFCAKPVGQEWPAIPTPKRAPTILTYEEEQEDAVWYKGKDFQERLNRIQTLQDSIRVILDSIDCDKPLTLDGCGDTQPLRIVPNIPSLNFEDLRCEVLVDDEEETVGEHCLENDESLNAEGAMEAVD